MSQISTSCETKNNGYVILFDCSEDWLTQQSVLFRVCHEIPVRQWPCLDSPLDLVCSHVDHWILMSAGSWTRVWNIDMEIPHVAWASSQHGGWGPRWAFLEGDKERLIVFIPWLSESTQHHLCCALLIKAGPLCFNGRKHEPPWNGRDVSVTCKKNMWDGLHCSHPWKIQNP